MNRLPLDLPRRLRKAGLTVVEVDGWQTRGRPASTGGFSPVGVLNHHTGAFDREGDLADDLAYARWMFLEGRPDLPPPLCQLSISAEGTVYVGAAGRANHAGTAKASGSVAAGDGNRLYAGIEWMLSGTQPIPAKMYKAGATTNAVLLDIIGSSVQAVSCHYQTSVTGKWDIGDPSGVPFGNAKVLNVPKFRAAVQAERDRLNRPPRRPSKWLTFQHTSLQVFDTTAAKASDIEKIFSRGKMILTGTEAGGPRAKDTRRLLAEKAEKHGYRLHVPDTTDGWVAVKKDRIKPGTRFRTGLVPVVYASEGLGKHTAKGIAWVTYQDVEVGTVTVGASHYMTRGRRPGDPNWVLNKRLANALGDWAREKGKGGALVFYGGDQNIPDRTEDTFFGSPLTSAWDEVGRWEGTGHGNIDVIASYDGDVRVSWVLVDAKPDSEIPLETDHFLVEAVAKVLVPAA
jgi:hypothetical protein